ncbi:MAG: DNA translocase FtsK 4TM domain-containing protein, partial [Planctomycetota bacterium]|nr:DNA translocase FtsK 4TM domain-containing protein [Planctomycetota bacterium]
MNSGDNGGRTGQSRFRLGLAGIGGLALAGLGAFLLLSLVTTDPGPDFNTAARENWTGLAGAWLAFACGLTLGESSARILALLLVFWGGQAALGDRFSPGRPPAWLRLFGGALILLAVSLGHAAAANRYDLNTGGFLALYLSPPLLLYFGRWGIIIAALGVFAVGILLAFGEEAVFALRRTAFGLRDAVLGLASLAPRLGRLAGLLFSPRLAPAGGPGAGERASAAPAPPNPPEIPTARTCPETERFRQAPPRGWRVRERFVSGFFPPDSGSGEGENLEIPFPGRPPAPAREEPPSPSSPTPEFRGEAGTSPRIPPAEEAAGFAPRPPPAPIREEPPSPASPVPELGEKAGISPEIPFAGEAAGFAPWPPPAPTREESPSPVSPVPELGEKVGISPEIPFAEEAAGFAPWPPPAPIREESPSPASPVPGSRVPAGSGGEAAGGRPEAVSPPAPVRES